jgi:hypothetical protein
MEDSKVRKRIIDLGKTIVKELELDPGVDTLAKWMAHYVAEKIELAEKLTGKGKSEAEKECYEIILKLWEHRWAIPRGKPFLKDFEPLFETLEKLNPNREESFFIPQEIQFDFNEGNDKENTKSLFYTAISVDRIARALIFNLLTAAISNLELSGNRGEIIRNAIELIDCPDTKSIRFISLKKDDESKKPINELQKRINDLEEFSSIRDSLLDSYKKELSKIEK